MRCLANDSSMSSKCQRCTRSNRECVYTTRSKTRRRKRTDTRVTELEEKVRGLSILLENRKANSNQLNIERDDLQYTGLEDEIRSQHQSGQSGELSTEGISPLAPPTPRPQITSNDTEYEAGSYNQRNMASRDMEGNVPSIQSPSFPDVIDRGILSMTKATELYDRYVNDLLPLYVANRNHWKSCQIPHSYAYDKQLPCRRFPGRLDRGEVARVQTHIVPSCACRKRRRVQISSIPQTEQGDPTDLRYKGDNTGPQIDGNMSGYSYFYSMDIPS